MKVEVELSVQRLRYLSDEARVMFADDYAEAAEWAAEILSAVYDFALPPPDAAVGPVETILGGALRRAHQVGLAPALCHQLVACSWDHFDAQLRAGRLQLDGDGLVWVVR